MCVELSSAWQPRLTELRLGEGAGMAPCTRAPTESLNTIVHQELFRIPEIRCNIPHIYVGTGHNSKKRPTERHALYKQSSGRRRYHRQEVQWKVSM